MTPRTAIFPPSRKFVLKMGHTLHIPTAEAEIFDPGTLNVEGNASASADNARWQRHQIVTRVALFIFCFVGTALAMITLAP